MSARYELKMSPKIRSDSISDNVKSQNLDNGDNIDNGDMESIVVDVCVTRRQGIHDIW